MQNDMSRRTLLRAGATTAVAVTIANSLTGNAYADGTQPREAIQPNADDFPTMRAQWRALHVASGYDPAEPDIAAVLRGITASAKSSWSTMNKAADRTYLWEDSQLELHQSFAISRSFWRLYTMALGWATPGSEVAGDAAILADTIAGLDWMVAHYYRADGQIIGNWYEWVISGPMAFNDAAVLIFDQLTPEQVAGYVSSVANFTPAPSGTAANLALTSTVVVGRGALAGDGATVAKGVAGLPPVLSYVTTGDGFYRDGSFIQHNYHPYLGAYGASILDALVPIFGIVAGTSWQIDSPVVYDWLENSFDPVIWNGAMMDLISGRTIARWDQHEHYHAHYVIPPALRLVNNAPADRRPQLRSMVKEWLVSDNFDDPIPRYNIPVLLAAKELIGDQSVVRRGTLVRSKVFHNQDRVVHRRPGWALGISMRSSRIANFESINGENLRGWLTANGALYLYVGVSGQFMDGYWATVDHSRLPGITTDVRVREPREGEGTRSPLTWAGGASLDARYTAVGFPLVEQGSSLACKKSWFCFDEEVVALGAGITAHDGHPVETILENRRLGSTGNERVLVDGAQAVPDLDDTASIPKACWMHLEGAGGYVLLTPTALELTREARTGRWSDVTTHANWADTTPLTRNYLTARIPHGQDPAAKSYAYGLLPTASAARTASYSARSSVEVLSNTSDIQAVRQKTSGVLAVNFWTAGSTPQLASDAGCSVVLKKQSNRLALAIADPTHESAPFTVTVRSRATKVLDAEPGLDVVSLNPLTVRVDPANTFGATLTLHAGT